MNSANKVLHDLNLVRVFIAIWDTRNLTDAGERLRLTQPAVSHALRRLREAFDDPLFVRAPGGVRPTGLAARLHQPLSQAVQIIQHAVQETNGFDPATAQRVFRVAMSDVSEFFFLPALMRWLAAAAPQVHLRIVPLDPESVMQSLKAGEVDLAIGFLPDLVEDEVQNHYLFTDTFVCLVRAGHPITRAAASNADLGSLGYVYGGTTAVGHHFAERWLTKIGIARQIVLRLGHFTVAPSVVRTSDLAVIFPESVSNLINTDQAFALIQLPPGRPTIEIRAYVHVHFSGDAGIAWFLDALVRLFGKDRPAAAP